MPDNQCKISAPIEHHLSPFKEDRTFKLPPENGDVYVQTIVVNDKIVLF